MNDENLVTETPVLAVDALANKRGQYPLSASRKWATANFSFLNKTEAEMLQRPLAIIFFLSICVTLAGCAYVGVTETNDPNKKLSQAQAMWEMERYIPAEQLALDAIELARESGNTLAEANAHRYLGTFYQSSLYLQHGDWYEPVGRYDPTYELSKSHFLQAKALWKQRGDDWGIATELFNLGTVAILQQRAADACPLYEQAIDLYQRAIFTGVAHPWNRRFEDFPAMVKAFAEQIACEFSQAEETQTKQ